MIYIVLYHCSVIGLYTSVTDANIVQKGIPGAIIQQCRLNTETDIGEQLLRSPA